MSGFEPWLSKQTRPATLFSSTPDEPFLPLGKLIWATKISFTPKTLLSPASPYPRQVRSQLNAYLRVLLGPREAREGTMAWWNGHGGLRGPQGSEAWSGSPAGGRLLASCTSAATAAET